MHPFLNVSKLSDEDIIERLGKAYTMLNAQVALGHTPTVMSIKDIIASLEAERSDRMANKMKDEYNKKYPDALKPIELGKLEK